MTNIKFLSLDELKDAGYEAYPGDEYPVRYSQPEMKDEYIIPRLLPSGEVNPQWENALWERMAILSTAPFDLKDFVK